MDLMGPYLEIDRQIADLATRQDGVVRHDQLRALGLSQKAIQHRRKIGWLVDRFWRVYSVGHRRLSPTGRRLAAVWAYGSGAALSRRSAAAAWDLRAGGAAPIHVTVPARSGVARPGTRLHLTTKPLETTRLDLLPITTPARTILDLAGLLTFHQLEATMKQAEVLQLLDVAALEAMLDAHPRHRGRRSLLVVLDRARDAGLSLTLSELEVRFAALCDRHGLPRPAANARPLGWRVDFLWPTQRVVAETDGWQAHRTRTAFEGDRRRDQALAVAGYRVVRFTHRQVVATPAEVAATLSALLGGGLDSAPAQRP